MGNLLCVNVISSLYVGRMKDVEYNEGPLSYKSMLPFI